MSQTQAMEEAGDNLQA